LWRLLYLHL